MHIQYMYACISVCEVCYRLYVTSTCTSMYMYVGLIDMGGSWDSFQNVHNCFLELRRRIAVVLIHRKGVRLFVI